MELHSRGLRGLRLGAACGIALLLALYLSGCWGLFWPCVGKLASWAVEETRRALEDPPQLQIQSVRWLEQDQGYLIAVDYTGYGRSGDSFSGTRYFHWRRWGDRLELLETRSQQGLAENQLSASLDSCQWTPGEDPSRLKAAFSWRDPDDPGREGH